MSVCICDPLRCPRDVSELDVKTQDVLARECKCFCHRERVRWCERCQESHLQMCGCKSVRGPYSDSAKTKP
jgi:hypothetical protein